MPVGCDLSRSSCARFGVLSLVTLTLILAFASEPAGASTAKIENRVLVYLADPNEQNDVRFGLVCGVGATCASTAFPIHDAGANIGTPLFSGCTITLIPGHDLDCGIDFDTISAVLGDRSDRAVVTHGIPVTFSGGQGNDELIGADCEACSADKLIGNTGADTLRGRHGSDILDGDSPGAGNDTLSGAHQTDLLLGRSGDDTLDGGPESDWLNGGPGNDVLNGGDGTEKRPEFDVLEGGGGNDLLLNYGGNGDVLKGEGSDGNVCTLNPLDCGFDQPDTGIDTVSYASRTATVVVSLNGVADDGESGEGDNVMPDVENLITGSGADFLVGSAKSNSFNGGEGDDSLSGAGNGDFLAGAGGRDSLLGGGGGDNLVGGADDDFMLGEAGDDTLVGGGGRDFLLGDEGVDSFDAGEGDDDINSRDGLQEQVSCGPGDDSADVDRLDVTDGCEEVFVGIGSDFSAAGTLTTDVEGDGATPQHPVEATITTPGAGSVNVEEEQTDSGGPGSCCFTIFDQQFLIVTSPDGTPANPYFIEFRIDASLIPPDQDENGVFVFKDGSPVPDCDPSPPRLAGTAEPDPCIASRRRLADLDVEITVLTSTASDWNLGLDTDPPEIQVDTPAADAVYTLSQQVQASFACTDQGSGTASCVGTVPDGGLLDTGSIGVKSFEVDAADKVGNRSSASRIYTVTYGVCLLYDSTRLHVQGSTIPVKLQICDANGSNLSSSGIALTAVSFDAGTPAVGSPANPDRRFRFAGKQYVYNLKTNGLGAGTHTLNFTVEGDPVLHPAAFRLR